MFTCSDNHTPNFFIVIFHIIFYRLAEHLNESLYRSYVCLAFSIVRARIIFFLLCIYYASSAHSLLPLSE